MWILLAKIYLLVSSIIGNQRVVGNSTSCKSSGCCVNEYKDNGKCKECPHGTYGVNCSSKCPSGHDGPLCDKKCDPRNGCQECSPGTFGLNCSGKCSNKYYEQFCTDRCMCTSGQYCNARDDCLECLLGSFEGECYRICNTPYYGRICHKECNCTSTQDCDQLYGCLQEKKATPTTTSIITTSDSSIWKNISFAFFGFIFAAGVVGGLLCLKPSPHTVVFSYAIWVRPELAAEDSEAAAGTAHEYLQEEAVGNVDNVYADLRTSKMVDSAVINATGDSEPVDDGNRHRKLNYAHIPEENYDMCTTEAASEENTMHDYAYLPKNFQYSILSLKRNVDPSLLVDLEVQPKGPVDDAYDLIDICRQTYNKSSDDNSSESDSSMCMSDSEIKNAVGENGFGK